MGFTAEADVGAAAADVDAAAEAAAAIVAASAGGGASSTTWALVPLTPNELTAPRRGSAPPAHRRVVLGSSKDVPSSEMRGLSWFRCRFGAMRPSRT
ncbi:MAG TPA: hypothetical protein VFS00_34835, partial [Polyangiaceae bacterium]|nr:hypothetical protein [Polyangiaceae bacterium]